VKELGVETWRGRMVGFWAGTGNFYVGVEISNPVDIKYSSQNWPENNHPKIGRRVLGYTGLFISPSAISDPCGTVAGMVTPKWSMSTERETLQVSVLPYRCSICWILRAPNKRFWHTLDSLGRWPRPASSFRSAQAATLLEFHIPLTNCFVRRWFCVVHGPKPPLHRHNWLSFSKIPRHRTLSYSLCTPFFVTTTPLAVEPGSTPRSLVQEKRWEILYLLICSFLPCLSWLLRSRVRKFRRDLWITLYVTFKHIAF